MLVKIVLVGNQKQKNGQNDELGAQLSQVFCLFPFVKIFARKGTLLSERAPYSPEKGTTKGRKLSHPPSNEVSSKVRSTN